MAGIAFQANAFQNKAVDGIKGFQIRVVPASDGYTFPVGRAEDADYAIRERKKLIIGRQGK